MIKKIFALFLLAAPLAAQVQIGKGVQIGSASGGGGSTNPGPQQAVSFYPEAGTTSTLGPTHVTVDVSTGNNLSVPGVIAAPQVTVSSLNPGNCVVAGDGGALTDTGQPCGTGSGTLSGQTINFLPRATSATASTISSQFGESGSGGSAVGSYDGQFFSAIQLARCEDTQCFNLGGGLVSYGGGQGSSSLQSYYLGVTGTPQNSLMLKPTYLGSGSYGGGFADNRSSNGMFHTSVDLAVPGIFQINANSSQRDSVGDGRWLSNDSITNAGCMQASDECIETIASFDGNSFGYLHATIASVSGAELLLSGQSGCAQSRSSFSGCNATTGAQVVDTTTPGFTANMTGNIHLSYGTQSDLTAWTINTPATISSAWGYANSTDSPPIWGQTNASMDSPVPATFIVNLSLNSVSSPGPFTTGNACYVTTGSDGGQGTGQFYQTQLTAGAVSGSTQTITMNVLGAGVNVVVMQGGECGYSASFDKYLSYFGYREVIPILGSITGNELIYAAVSFGGLTILPETGQSPVTSDNTANSAITLYPTATVVAQNGTTVGGTPAPDGNPSIGPHLTGSFIAGHTIEGPLYFRQQIVPITMTTNCDMPGSCAPAIFAYEGAGMAGPGAGGINVFNINAYGIYAEGGGDSHYVLPASGVSVNGPFASPFSAQYLPEENAPGGPHALLSAFNFAPGKTSGTILSMPSGAILTTRNEVVGSFNYPVFDTNEVNHAILATNFMQDEAGNAWGSDDDFPFSDVAIGTPATDNFGRVIGNAILHLGGMSISSTTKAGFTLINTGTGGQEWVVAGGTGNGAINFDNVTTSTEPLSILSTGIIASNLTIGSLSGCLEATAGSVSGTGSACGSGATPPGSSGNMIYNNAGAYGADPDCNTDGSGHLTCATLEASGGSGSDPSELVLAANGNAPVVNAGSFTVAAPATISTALTWVAPSAPCTGFVFVEDASGVGSLICNPHFDDGATTAGKLTANEPIVAPSYQFGTPFTGAISSPSAGVFSFDTTTIGNGAGTLKAVEVDASSEVSVSAGGNLSFMQPTVIGARAITSLAVPVSVNCSTSGTISVVEPMTGNNHRILIYESACLGTASYTFGGVFTAAPMVLSQSLASTVSTSTTAVTVTGTTSTGYAELVGW